MNADKTGEIKMRKGWFLLGVIQVVLGVLSSALSIIFIDQVWAMLIVCSSSGSLIGEGVVNMEEA